MTHLCGEVKSLKGSISQLLDYGVEVEDTASCRFVPLNGPRFYDLETGMENLSDLLPAGGSEDIYRITLTGTCEEIDLEKLQKEYAAYPNLTFRDRTRRPEDLWGNAGEDSFEGLYFALLKEKADRGEEVALLAAKLSRQILNGEEVEVK